MTDSKLVSGGDELPDDPEKRESMKTMAAAAAGVAIFTDAEWWPFSDDTGLEEPLRILNNGSEVDDGVEQLNFGNGVTATIGEDGIKIDIDQDFTGDITTDGDLGVGTRNPDDVAGGKFGAGEVRAAVSGSGHQRVVTEAFVDNKNDGIQYTGVSYRGSKSNPSAVQDSDLMTYLSTYGYDGTDVVGTGGLQFRVDGTVSTGVIPMKYRVILSDASGSAFVHSQGLPDGTLEVGQGAVQSLGGGATYGNGAFELGSNGARLELNGSGEVVVVDEAGNETVIS